jgi:hypothetical protein
MQSTLKSQEGNAIYLIHTMVPVRSLPLRWESVRTAVATASSTNDAANIGFGLRRYLKNFYMMDKTPMTNKLTFVNCCDPKH